MNNKTLTHFENVLHNLLNKMPIPAARIKDAITYTLFPGGKRLRPALVYLCGNLLEINQQALDSMAAAIEFTHCYSLVHDDLPAMDNDDMRRGKPSCHRAFDEATAILVGDAMQILAIDILLNDLPHALDTQQVINITKELIYASGPAGMISGQSLDLTELANPQISEAELRDIHQLKTGKLISACIHMVIAAGQPTSTAAEALRQFAQHLGLVFQMQDDYLDKYDDGKLLGKNRSSDSANQKTTFATLYHQEDLARLIAQHYQQAEDTLTIFAQRADNLREFLHGLHNRSN